MTKIAFEIVLAILPVAFFLLSKLAKWFFDRGEMNAYVFTIVIWV